MEIHFDENRLKRAKNIALIFAALSLFIALYFFFYSFDLLYGLAGAAFFVILLTAYLQTKNKLEKNPVLIRLTDDQMIYDYAEHSRLQVPGQVVIPYVDIKSATLDGQSIFDFQEVRNERAILEIHTGEPSYFKDLPKTDEMAANDEDSSLKIGLFDISKEDKDALLAKLQDVLSYRNRRGVKENK